MCKSEERRNGMREANKVLAQMWELLEALEKHFSRCMGLGRFNFVPSAASPASFVVLFHNLVRRYPISVSRTVKGTAAMQPLTTFPEALRPNLLSLSLASRQECCISTATHATILQTKRGHVLQNHLLQLIVLF